MSAPEPGGVEPSGAEPGGLQPGRVEPEPADPGPVDVREQMRQQMLDGLGGWTGMVLAAVPTVVFVVVNAVGDLREAVVAAIATTLLLTGYRLARRQPVQQALNGLFGVLVAAVIAARTGQARGYFLLGIWSSFLYGGVFLASMLVGRPLVGVVWEFLEPTPGPAWHRRPVLRRAYLVATAAATLVFAARAVVQLTLFRRNSTGGLAVARIAMGYPLTIAAVGLAFFVVRRARRILATQQGGADVDPAGG